MSPGRSARSGRPQGARADRPVQALPDLRGHRVHGVDDRGRARVRRPRLRLLLVGEHQRAQAEDLVDLGAVEQVRRALRSQLRVVREDDRAREQQVRAPLRPGEHRPGVPVVQLAGRGEGPLGRVGGREERARGDGDQGVRGDERRPQRDLARGAVGAGGVVDDVDAQAQDVVRPGQRLGGDDEPPVQRQAAPLDAAAGDGLDGVLRGEREGHGVLARPVDGDRGIDLPGHALLPGEVPVVAVDQLVDGAAVGVVDGPGAQLQEPQSQVQDGAGAAVEQDLGAGAVRLVGEPGRGEDAELPPQAVLLRRGAVGVEQVALEEHGVGDAGGLVERGGAGRPCPGALVTAPPSAAAPPCRPTSAAPAAERYARSASRVSRRSRTQPASGKCASIAARHTATGSRNVASSCHGTSPTCTRSGAPVNTVPENSSSSGTSPPSRPWRYFVAAMSRS